MTSFDDDSRDSSNVERYVESYHPDAKWVESSGFGSNETREEESLSRTSYLESNRSEELSREISTIPVIFDTDNREVSESSRDPPAYVSVLPKEDVRSWENKGFVTSSEEPSSSTISSNALQRIVESSSEINATNDSNSRTDESSESTIIQPTSITSEDTTITENFNERNETFDDVRCDDSFENYRTNSTTEPKLEEDPLADLVACCGCWTLFWSFW